MAVAALTECEILYRFLDDDALVKTLVIGAEGEVDSLLDGLVSTFCLLKEQIVLIMCKNDIIVIFKSYTLKRH